MHDIKFIRENPEAFDAGLARRGVEPLSGSILALDEECRNYGTLFQEAQAKRNQTAKAIGQAKASGNNQLFEELREKASLEKSFEESFTELSQKKAADLHALLAAHPNLPDAEVPDGDDETQNVEVSRWGTPRAFNFAPKEHADLGPVLGLDFETGALISGARFTFLRGQMARLQRALGQFMLDQQTITNGYNECAPPLLVKDEAVFGTGQLPKFSEDLFQTSLSFSDSYLLRIIEQAKGDLASQFDSPTDPAALAELERGTLELMRHQIKSDFPPARRWLIPTAEVSLTNSVREQILPDSVLPIRMTALTPCFRSEAGAAGKDTRGYIRQHQFEKVELVSVCRPEDSAAEHERMVKAAESILEALDLPYRKVLLCAGDMGFTARKTYDLEVWLPGQDAYREISSISNCGNFQARRMNTRYRPEGGKGTEFVHTLNGSGLAVGRTLVAVLENYQQADGSVTVPAALLPYMGGITALVPEPDKS